MRALGDIYDARMDLLQRRCACSSRTSRDRGLKPTWQMQMDTFTGKCCPPEKYVVGISLPGHPGWIPSGCAGTPGACSIPKASLHYPNMRNRTDALGMNLATDEKLMTSISPSPN
jgi:hypothetical protein